MNDNYQTRHPWMRAYRNEVWDMFGNYFIEHTIKVVPGYENIVADSLAVATSKFKTPSASQREYQVDIVNRPSILNNYKNIVVCISSTNTCQYLELSGMDSLFTISTWYSLWPRLGFLNLPAATAKE